MPVKQSLLSTLLLVLCLHSYAVHKPGRTAQFGFIENKGQMMDLNNKPAPYVLFKAEVPNLNIWITTTGLTYEFLKIKFTCDAAPPW